MYSLLLVFLFIPRITYSMDPGYIIELQNGVTTHIPYDLVRASNTLHTQSITDSSLCLKAPHVSFHGLDLFYQASSTPENTFHQFFTQLSHRDKHTLIRTAGKNHLNCPALTALLVQSYLPRDVQNLIARYCDDIKQGISYHMRSHMILSSKLTEKISTDEKTTVPYSSQVLLCEHGKMLVIPKHFDTKPILCRGGGPADMAISDVNISVSLCDEQDAILVPAGTRYGVLARFQHKNTHYALTLNDFNRSKLLLWQKKDNTHYAIQKIELPSNIQTAIISNNGSQIVIKTQHCILLCSIDHSLKKDLCTIKTMQPYVGIYPPIVLDHANNIFVQPTQHRPRFNAFGLLWDQPLFKTKFIFYDFNGTPITEIYSQGSCINLAFSYDDNRLIAVMRSRIICNLVQYNEASRICIYDTADKNNISLLTEFTCTKDIFPIKIDCSPYDNHFIISCKNGDLLLGKENSDHGYTIEHYRQQDCPHTTNDFFRQEIVFTPDKNFAFTHINYYDKSDVPNKILEFTSPRRPALAVFDLQKLACIGSSRIGNTVSNHNPLIALNKDASCVWTNCDSGDNGIWKQCRLYSSQELHFLKWFKTYSTLYQLYALNRLFIAYKNNEQLVQTCDAHNIVHCFDQEHADIQTCIKKYLYVEQEESILDKIKNFFLTDD